MVKAIELGNGIILSNIKQPYGGNVYASVSLNGKRTEVTYIKKLCSLSILKYTKFTDEENNVIRSEVIKYMKNNY